MDPKSFGDNILNRGNLGLIMRKTKENKKKTSL